MANRSVELFRKRILQAKKDFDNLGLYFLPEETETMGSLSKFLKDVTDVDTFSNDSFLEERVKTFGGFISRLLPNCEKKIKIVLQETWNVLRELLANLKIYGHHLGPVDKEENEQTKRLIVKENGVTPKEMEEKHALKNEEMFNLDDNTAKFNKMITALLHQLKLAKEANAGFVIIDPIYRQLRLLINKQENEIQKMTTTD